MALKYRSLISSMVSSGAFARNSTSLHPAQKNDDICAGILQALLESRMIH